MRRKHRRRSYGRRFHGVPQFVQMGAPAYGGSEFGIDAILPDNKLMTLGIGLVAGYFFFSEKKA